MIISSNSIFSKINELNRQNSEALAMVVERIKAAGSNIIPRSTDFTGIRQAVSFQYNSDVYQNVFDDLTRAKQVTAYILQIGQIAVDALFEMQRLAKAYPGLNPTGQTSAEDSFDTQAGVVENLKSSAAYEGITVFRSGTIFSVAVDPSSGNLDIAFDPSDIPDVSTATLADPVAALLDVNAALNAIHSYIGKAYSYDSQVSGYSEMAAAIIAASQAGRATFTDTMAQDLTIATQIQVRQQNIAAFISQANVNAMSAAKIFELKQT